MTGMQFKFHRGLSGEDRRNDRYDTLIPARMLLPTGELVRGFVINLSKDGFMAQTEAEAAAGDLLELEVVGYLPFRARVIWSVDGKIGCEFERTLTWEHFSSMCGRARPRLVGEGG